MMSKGEMEMMTAQLAEMFQEYLETLSDEPLESDPDAYDPPRDRAERVFRDLIAWLQKDYNGA